uniref:Leupaxin n=1 Tax=Amazona collaria TaxID=241587 RepID=A0A8B9FZF8_9PSIT
LPQRLWTRCTGKAGLGKAKPVGASLSTAWMPPTGAPACAPETIPSMSWGRGCTPHSCSTAGAMAWLPAAPSLPHVPGEIPCAQLSAPAPSIFGVLTALGRTWHPEHFTCARCGQELGAQPFFERDGQPYCEDDYHQAFAPCCAYCAGPIREVLTALDQTWHPEHFFCANCGKHPHGRDPPYPPQDFLAMFAPKCQGCERPVTGSYLSALEGVWHPECFVCTVSLEGRPYCEQHFHHTGGGVPTPRAAPTLLKNFIYIKNHLV